MVLVVTRRLVHSSRNKGRDISILVEVCSPLWSAQYGSGYAAVMAGVPFP